MVEPTSFTDWFSFTERMIRLPDIGERRDVWLGEVLEHLRRLLQARSVVCVLAEAPGVWEQLIVARGAEPRCSARFGEPAGLVGAVLNGRSLASASAAAAAAAAAAVGRSSVGEIARVDEIGDAVPAFDPDWDGFADVDPDELSVVRLRVRGRGAVVLTIGGKSLEGAAADELGHLLERAIRNWDRVLQLDEKVITDELTGVYNYRFLRTALRKEMRRASRFRHELSVLMIDVDHLKEYNEQFGHLGGSQVLRILAEVVRAGIRDIDLLAKYGGDEFLLILPQTDKHGAEIVADRLRQRVARHVFPPLKAGAMTCSMGVASYPADGDQPEALVAAADQALFAAKRRGRNRVQVA